MTLDEIVTKARKIVVDHLDCEADQVTEAASFEADLGADSLDNIELIMAFEEEFDVEISDAVAETVKTFGQSVDAIEAALGS